MRRQLQVLKEFMESFDFVRMKPDDATIKGNAVTLPKPGGPRTPATVRVLSEPGQAYAVYVEGGAYAELVMELPAAPYRAEWIDTKTGRSAKTETFNHAGGKKFLASPRYSEDTALHVQRQPR